MSSKLKPLPDFADETEEDAFWQTHDSTAYVDWSKAERVRLTLTQLEHALAHARQELGCQDRPELIEYWRARVEQLMRHITDHIHRHAA